ncbi:MAG: AMP-binding protein [Clostridia bacterium]|nr:AMP-binding protein [Clostridia bacterium]
MGKNTRNEIFAPATKSFYKVRQIRDLKDLMAQTKELYGDRYAFEIKKRDKSGMQYITYNEYCSDIDALGTALIEMGYKDKHIAVSANNRYEWCLSYMSVVNGVGVIVPIDKELLFPDINGIFEISETKLLFCDKLLLNTLERDKMNPEIQIVCFDYDEDKDGILSFSKLVAKGKSLLAKGDRRFLDAEIDPDKMSTLLFTSGTTGAAKGVMLCHRNFCFEVMSAMSVLKIYPEDCGISMLPLHHTYESTIILFFAPYCGAKVTFCDGFKYVLKNMKEFSPSVFVAVPLILETVHRRLMQRIKAKPHGELMFKVGSKVCKTASKFGIDLKKVFFKEIQEAFGGNMRLIICGAAPIRPEILRDFDAFGIQILFGYGLTECAPLAVMNNDKLHLAESVGLALPETQAKIIDPDPQTGVGELCVKGKMVMLGYYKNQQATDEVLDSDGFLHTGDLARLDEKGRFYISGRIKNVIVTENGKNIYPEELEYHLTLNSVVNEAMVYADTNAKGETIVKASIFPDDEEVRAVLGRDDYTEDDLQTLFKEVVKEVNRKLPQYKHIKSFTLRRKEFLKSASKKILRFKEENFTDGTE